MANFSVRVCKVEKKAQHPNADRLTIYNVGGYNCISNKLPTGEDRYEVGDLVVYIPEQSVLPEWLLKKMELWNDEKSCGVLGGSKGNRVVTIKLRGIPSTGLLYPVINGKIDYIEFLSYPDLAEVKPETTKFLLAAAVYIGNPRLIDNIIFEVKGDN